MLVQQRTCIECGHTLRGRSDKKYCNDYCRNTHNNRLNHPGLGLQRSVNQTLWRNRRLLEIRMSGTDEPVRCRLSELLQQGFDPSFKTHSRVIKKQQYDGCYDLSYKIAGDEITIRRENADQLPLPLPRADRGLNGYRPFPGIG